MELTETKIVVPRAACGPTSIQLSFSFLDEAPSLQSCGKLVAGGERKQETGKAKKYRILQQRRWGLFYKLAAFMDLLSRVNYPRLRPVSRRWNSLASAIFPHSTASGGRARCLASCTSWNADFGATPYHNMLNCRIFTWALIARL